MRRPKSTTATLTSGAGIRQNSVSRQSTRAITPIKKTAVKKVSVKYMMPGPSIMRTAFRSLVARAMMSPVRYFA